MRAAMPSNPKLSEFRADKATISLPSAQPTAHFNNDGCTTYHVRIIPPKNTFLDLFGLGGRSPDHPTEEQTKAAASVLKQHSINHQPLKISYLGGGLYPDPRQKCLYHGTGMWFDAPDWVWVRQDGRKGLYPHLEKP